MKRLNIFFIWLIIFTFIMSQVSFASEKILFYHTDPAGTPIAMSDESGVIVWEADYKPFGEDWNVPVYPENNRTFVGKEKDKETGLHYFGARYYSAEIGRFLAVDPVGPVDPMTGKVNGDFLANPQQLNMYAYSLNNPYRYLDPNGAWAADVHSGIGNRKGYGTYTWAKQVGFSESEAKSIAIGNNATDIGPGTTWLPFGAGGDQSRHFDNLKIIGDSRDSWAEWELQKAVAFAKKGNMKAALGHLGKGLHSLQDKYAHRGWDTGLLELIKHPEWYDDWHDPRNVEAARQTEIKSKEYLERFRKGIK
ncbi:tRNA nuclease WapA precursor [bacterium BMS3Abin07]|nr:tRNA nuclease WapA precursor [bacterium BMS3Abin07]GBE32059.1 tRNA nuclease WapA precursor [bacterium BMS3Bbin05]HDO22246.1 hypothetical protein [Nitrospirota bacterium]HDZ88100.1 hypothetical protein [Nitrospirota bacterium]